MKEIFDGFQSKPLSIGHFTQLHKAILLENYRETVVKILIPHIKAQAQYDILFINYVKPFIKKLALDKIKLSEEQLHIYE